MIKIISGKRGWHLKVNNLYISHGITRDGGVDIRAIRESGIPYGATEWVSIKAIRKFWHKYMIIVIASTNKPCRSIWGQLKFIEIDSTNIPAVLPG